MRSRFRHAVVAAAALALVAAGPSASLVESATSTSAVTDPATGPVCDELDPALCLLPFPNDRFTVADASTVTGRRVNLHPAAMPRNGTDETTGQAESTAGGGEGKPIDPTEWNRNDGFSPGSLIMTYVPGLDLHRTWGTGDLPHSQVGPDEPGYFDHRDHIADIGRYQREDAPIVLINAETGRRHPFWSELDTHPQTTDARRLLLVRPAVNLEEGTRYIVALRDLKDADGNMIAARDSFSQYRDAKYAKGKGHTDGRGNNDRPEAEGRAAHMEDIFDRLDDAGVEREDLYLAWDFTVASADSLAGRVLHIRDDAFSQLGDTDLADLTVEGDSPDVTIDYVDEDDSNSAWVVHGAVTVPNYLDRPQQTVDLGRYDRQGHDVPNVVAPGSRFFYDPTDGDHPVYGDGRPDQNPAAPTMAAPFACAIPKTAIGADGRVTEPAIPVLYGHGLLGQRIEGAYWSGGRELLARHNAMMCGVDWIGMAQQDLANVATILVDGSNFPSLADRAQQGFLNFLYVGRAMIHPDGLAADPAFQDAVGTSVIDTDELFYEGNSQGGIMGGALTALAPDFTKAVLGVPAMNYSTLLNRSVDWEGEGPDPTDPDVPAYSYPFYEAYGDPAERQLMFGLMQMLWDRAEGNGYAAHMTDDPYPNTPPHQVLMHVAYGDFQVANAAAEVEARTVGAELLETSLAVGRHWSSDPTFGLETWSGQTGGSALVYFDSGNLVPPNGNLPPAHVGSDPHGHPRGDHLGGVQRRHFFDTGVIIDVRDGAPYWTRQCTGGPVPCPNGTNDTN